VNHTFPRRNQNKWCSLLTAEPNGFSLSECHGLSMFLAPLLGSNWWRYGVMGRVRVWLDLLAPLITPKLQGKLDSLSIKI